MPVRNLMIVLGDQLDPESEAFDGFHKKHDAVWMAEVASESEWDFLMRHETALSTNQRMSLQVRNVKRKKPVERKQIAQQAKQLKSALTS